MIAGIKSTVLVMKMSDQVRVEYIKEINTQPYLKVYIKNKNREDLFAEIYPCETAWAVEDGLLDVEQLPQPVRDFYEWAVQHEGIQEYLAE